MAFKNIFFTFWKFAWVAMIYDLMHSVANNLQFIQSLNKLQISSTYVQILYTNVEQKYI